MNGTHPTVRVDVAAGAASYPVLVGRGLRRDVAALLRTWAPGFRYAVVSDTRVAPLYAQEIVEACRAEGLRADLFTFPAGEHHKTREEWSLLTDRLLDAGVGRDGVVVAVGGGVVGDLAGFVAATYLRGIPVVQVPTSLVAMVDASVGGKTGVDTGTGKNLVGAFHPPRLVLVDPEVVATLPEEERIQGLAEALKHGAIVDPAYLESLVSGAPALREGEPGAVQAAVVRSIQIKADVVSRDEREGGVRQILNFGHTFGHALETASGYAIGHGSAVAAGMVMEARLGERLGVTEEGVSSALLEAAAAFGLGGVRPPPGGADAVSRLLASDKKAREGRVRFVLLRRLGEVHSASGWSHAAPREAVEEVLQEALLGG